jgi:hypothetical protein
MSHNYTHILVVLLAFVLFPRHVCAQPDDLPPLDEARMKEIKAQKAAYLTIKLSLSPEESERFWPIYNTYDDARQKFMKNMRENMRNAQQRGDQLSEAEALAALKKGMTIREQELELERTYNDRFVKAIGAVKTLELHRAERDFHRQVLRRYRDRMDGSREGRPGPPPQRP